MIQQKVMNPLKTDDVVYGVLGLFTGGFTWLKMQMLNIGSDALQFISMCLVAASAAAMGVVGKKLGELAWKKVNAWYQKRKPPKQ